MRNTDNNTTRNKPRSGGIKKTAAELVAVLGLVIQSRKFRLILWGKKSGTHGIPFCSEKEGQMLEAFPGDGSAGQQAPKPRS